MKKLTLALLATASLSLITVGCGGKSSSSTGNTNTTNTSASGGVLCNPMQVYTTQYGCLEQRLDRCAAGMGYEPTSGACVMGTLGGGQVALGYWQNPSLTVTNVAKFQELLRDEGSCYQSTCPTQNWIFFSISTQLSSYIANGGGGSFVPGYAGSSAAQFQYGANYGYPQSQVAQINAMSQGNGYWGRLINLQFTSQARPTQTGFEVVAYTRYNNFGQQSTQKKIQIIATYVDAARTQLQARLLYQGVVVAEGLVNRQ